MCPVHSSKQRIPNSLLAARISSVKALPSGHQKIYVCHPFSRSVNKSFLRIQQICKELISEGVLPIAPQLYFLHFLNEKTQRQLILNLCCSLVELCDEVRVYGTRSLTSGMCWEIAAANLAGIPVRFEC